MHPDVFCFSCRIWCSCGSLCHKSNRLYLLLLPPPFLILLLIFPLAERWHTPLTLIFSFLATRKRCFFGVVLRDGSGGGVRCALLRNKRPMNAAPLKSGGELRSFKWRIHLTIALLHLSVSRLAAPFTRASVLLWQMVWHLIISPAVRARPGVRWCFYVSCVTHTHFDRRESGLSWQWGTLHSVS